MTDEGVIGGWFGEEGIADPLDEVIAKRLGEAIMGRFEEVVCDWTGEVVVGGSLGDSGICNWLGEAGTSGPLEEVTVGSMGAGSGDWFEEATGGRSGESGINDPLREPPPDWFLSLIHI